MLEHFGEPRDILGSLLVIIGLFYALPSVIQVLRTGTSDGMSLSSQTLFVAFASSWTVYSINVQSLVLLVSSAFDVLCAIALSIAVGIRGKERGKNLVVSLSPLLIMVGLMLLLAFFGAETFVIVFSALLCVRWLPQIRESIKWVYSSMPATGISKSGSIWGLIMCFGWVVWGIYPLFWESSYEVDIPNILWGGTGVLSFCLQLLLVRRRETLVK